MSSEELAEEIRAAYPDAEEIIVQYLSGYLVDDAGEDEDVIQVTHDILASVSSQKSPASILDALMVTLRSMLSDTLQAREAKKSGAGGLQKLDKVVDLSKTTQMSSTLRLGDEGVDLESINKGKCVFNVFSLKRIHDAYGQPPRASRVDMKKLEKQEAKLRVRCIASSFH